MIKSHEILTGFGRSARELIELLYEDQPLNQTEEMFIENHLALIQSAFKDWKRRHGP
jgi:hypothetical protein